MKTIVHMMRHGEVHNPKGILYGRLPGYHLSDTGAAQARAVADVLADHDISHVFASPLQRALRAHGEQVRIAGACAYHGHAAGLRRARILQPF